MARIVTLLACLAFWGAEVQGPVAAQSAPQPGMPQVVQVSDTPLVVVTADGTRHAFVAELALTQEEQSYGLMFRALLGDDRGMLFPFTELRRASFWMRNTIIPLDLIFVRRNGKIANIVEMAEPLTLTPRQSKGLVTAVFEVKGGLTARLGIKAGDQIYHPALGLNEPENQGSDASDAH